MQVVKELLYPPIFGPPSNYVFKGKNMMFRPPNLKNGQNCKKSSFSWFSWKFAIFWPFFAIFDKNRPKYLGFETNCLLFLRDPSQKWPLSGPLFGGIFMILPRIRHSFKPLLNHFFPKVFKKWQIATFLATFENRFSASKCRILSKKGSQKGWFWPLFDHFWEPV